uniref:Aurora kinase n=1 Tax=Angiostrongylus cantonensis TaxID=6313 RepID=A0A0K0CTR1_ANGCA
MEFAEGGQLYDRMKNEGNLDEAEAAKYARQLADSNIYCNAKRPENIIFDGNRNLKIADFGFAVGSSHSRHETYCGTLDHLPPEVKIGKWVIGVLLYEMLVGRPSFEFPHKNATQQLPLVML